MEELFSLKSEPLKVIKLGIYYQGFYYHYLRKLFLSQISSNLLLDCIECFFYIFNIIFKIFNKVTPELSVKFPILLIVFKVLTPESLFTYLNLENVNLNILKSQVTKIKMAFNYIM